MTSTRTLLIALGCASLALTTACQEKQVEPEPLPVAKTAPEPEPLHVDAATLPGKAVSGEPVELSKGMLAWETTAGTGTPLTADTAIWRISAWSSDGTQWFGDAEGSDELLLPTTDAGAFPGWGDAVAGMSVGSSRKIYVDPSFMDTPPAHWPVPGDTPSPIILDIELVSAGDSTMPADLPGVAVTTAAHEDSASGLRWYDITAGNGTPLADGETATLTISAWLADGTEVWSSQSPQSITIDEALMPGLRSGVLGMAPGGMRKLVIPASLGTGFNVDAAIPPGSTLVLDVTRDS